MKIHLPAALSVLVFSATLSASGGSIGIATSVGTVSVNQDLVSGKTDLSNGSRLQTTNAPSEIHLVAGSDVRLATRSEGTFFSDHVSLNQGALEVSKFGAVTIDASQLKITSDDSNAQAIVRLKKHTVEIASVGGSVNVLDGGMLTRVAAGTKMSFQQNGATPDQNQTTTGATPVPPNKLPSDHKTFIWVIGITAVAALAVGLTAAAQGKSPF